MYYLAMYFGNRCHDWFLPEQDAWSIHLIMRQRVTSLDHDLVFSVRALEGQIYLTPAPGFVWSEGKGRSERVMTDGTTLRMTGPLNITCVVWRVDRRGTAMRKYMFPERAAVRVGSDDANQICQKVGLMSGQQGDFLRQGQECVFTDRSRNGSFCNGIRVNGSQKLAVGDVVTMGAGLKVCWLGSVLAVNSPTRVKHIQLTPAEPFRPVAAERKDDAASSVKEYHLAPRIVQQPNTDIIKLEPRPASARTTACPCGSPSAPPRR